MRRGVSGNLAHLNECLSQHRKTKEFSYLLVDPTAECDPDHPLSLASLTSTLGPEAVTSVVRGDLNHAPHHWPALITLHGSNGKPCEYIAASAAYATHEGHAHKRYICAWLLSEHSAERVAEQIAQQCHALSPRGSTRAAPWFEPTRFELLHAAMNNAGALLGPIRCWLYPDSNGGFRSLESRPDSGQLEIPEIAQDVQHIAPQVAQLLTAWRRLNDVQRNNPPSRFAVSRTLPTPAHAYNLIFEAHQRGLYDPGDARCLCLHLLMVHPKLLLHPAIQRDVADAAAGKQRLAATFATYDDSAWQQIVAALPPARSY
ncbi:hypothetical protein ACIQUF_07665 [Pseudomonas sp. NPDC090233]|uniref:hypothetical protein n=1 Tax=Pseudomonas sp. NPDC090233 TaxID=3364479 RepID=UPI00383B7020